MPSEQLRPDQSSSDLPSLFKLSRRCVGRERKKADCQSRCKLTPALTAMVNLLQIKTRDWVFAFCLCLMRISAEGRWQLQHQRKLRQNIRKQSTMTTKIYWHELFVLSKQWRSSIDFIASVKHLCTSICSRGWSILAFLASASPFSHRSPLLCPSEVAGLLWDRSTACGHEALV